jgi:hypothetical protein
MTAKLFEQVKIMNKRLKKINMMGYIVFLKDGPQCQLMKVEKIKYNKKKKKQKNPSSFLANG